MQYRINRRTGDRISEIGMGTAYIVEAPKRISEGDSWDMDRALIAAVNHKRDSDSTGAVTVFGDGFKNGAKCRKKIKKTGHYCGKM